MRFSEIAWEMPALHLSTSMLTRILQIFSRPYCISSLAFRTKVRNDCDIVQIVRLTLTTHYHVMHGRSPTVHLQANMRKREGWGWLQRPHFNSILCAWKQYHRKLSHVWVRRHENMNHENKKRSKSRGPMSLVIGQRPVTRAVNARADRQFLCVRSRKKPRSRT